MKMIIIADDLTGAGDSGVQMSRAGIPSSVIFDVRELNSEVPLEGAAVDTDSRALLPREAYDRVFALTQALTKNDNPVLYKKIDSTLRGNLGAEIDAVLDASKKPFAVVAPAFPEIGRTTEKGIHYVNGIPLEQTEVANDPKTPVTTSSLVHLLKAQSQYGIGLLPETALSDLDTFVHLLNEMTDTGHRLIAVDITADRSLQALSRFLIETKQDCVWVGSAGLAQYLAQSLSTGCHRPLSNKQMNAGNSHVKSVMVVAGSLSGVTREQVRCLGNDKTVRLLQMSVKQLLQYGDGLQAVINNAVRQAVDAVDAGADIVLCLGTGREEVANILSREEMSGEERQNISARIIDRLGQIASRIIKTAPLRGLVLTGGDTARTVCAHIGANGIELFDEIEAGIPIGRLLGQRKLLTVTKAGAFGKPDSLTRAVKTIKGWS